VICADGVEVQTCLLLAHTTKYYILNSTSPS